MKTVATIAVLAIGGAAATGVGIATLHNEPLSNSGVAEVIQVEARYATRQVPRQECQHITVQRQRPVQDEQRVAGTAIGATIGGVLGNQIGGGRGKDLATVGGAIAGGIAGNRIQQQRQQNNTYTTVEEQCHTVMDSQRYVTGYDVTYRFNGDTGTIQMASKPGAYLTIDDGQVVLSN